MQFQALAELSDEISRESSRLEKSRQLAKALAPLEPGEAFISASYLSGELPEGPLGIGHATLQRIAGGTPASTATLDVCEVSRRLTEIGAQRGPASSRRKLDLLTHLFARCTPIEERFLRRLLTGELRQGAQLGILQDALARAYGVSVERVRRAVMLAGSLSEVARALASQGAAGLESFKLELFQPLSPMLAQTASDLSALETLVEPVLEYKFDGARVQLHRSGDDVRVFSRNLNDVTPAVPELVEFARSLSSDRFILDGEVLALGEDKKPLPFQVTMKRFGRRSNVTALRQKLPLVPYFFDILELEGQDLIDEPARRRYEALDQLAPPQARVPRLSLPSRDRADEFLRQALDAGHEGLMLKSLDAPYAAGRRGGQWLKYKPVFVLDLVVLAAEWGSGRRRGWLSNLHLGARDPQSGQFVMLGKTFKGMTDAMLREQTERLLALEVSRDRHTVYVQPTCVVEVAFDGVQESPQYPAGLTLRFARIKRHRPDKPAEEADTIDAIRAIHQGRRIQA